MLTQLDTVAQRLGITDAADDTLLNNLIALCTGRFERECNRKFDRQAGVTEEFAGDVAELVPTRYPLEAVTAFHLKSNETEGWVAQTDVDYVIRKACVISLGVPLGGASQQLRITYTGGYVLPGTEPGAGQTALPRELELAATEQVAYWYQRKNQLGLTGVSGPDGSIQNFANLDLLPHLKRVLSSYARWNP